MLISSRTLTVRINPRTTGLLRQTPFCLTAASQLKILKSTPCSGTDRQSQGLHTAKVSYCLWTVWIHRGSAPWRLSWNQITAASKPRGRSPRTLLHTNFNRGRRECPAPSKRSLLTRGRRKNKTASISGHNRFGIKGTLGCQACRKRHWKVLLILICEVG